MRGGRFCVLCGTRSTLETCQFWHVVFSWQAQHFVVVHFIISWQAQHYVTWRRCCFDESPFHGCANMAQCQKLWRQKIMVFGFLRKTCRKSLILRFKMPKLEEVSYDILVLEASYVKCPRRLARNACFRSRLHETCMNFCAKRSFWKLTKPWEVLLAFRKVAQRS